MQHVVRLFSLVALGVAVLVGPLCAENDPVIRVALFEDEGASGRGVPLVTQYLAKADDIEVRTVKGVEIAGGVLKDFDVVMFTGGSGSRQAATLGESGREEVRQFVQAGGGYIGICAGAYLACSGFGWGVGVLNAKTVSQRWRRGRGVVEIDLTSEARELTGLSGEKQDIYYVNGPIIQPDDRADIPEYETIAVFRTELAENDTPEGIMINSPALARARYGAGRVLFSSAHPEQTEGMEMFVERAVRWAAGKEPAVNQSGGD